MDRNKPLPPLPPFVRTILGTLLILIAIFFLFLAHEQIFFAKTDSDLIGAVAGIILILAVGVPGVLLILGKRAPTGLERALHIMGGVIAILLGIGLLGFVFVQGSSGGLQIRKAFLTIPLAIIGGGFVWISKGLKHAPQPPADETASDA